MATPRPTPTAEFSTYPLLELRTLWERDQVTADQMIGYLLLNLIELEQRVQQLQRATDASRSALAGPHVYA